MSHRRRGVVLAALLSTLVSGFAAVGAARADTLPASLAGEALVAGPNSTAGDGVFGVSVQCNTDQSGSFTFSASGTATGPYPGTFVESGSVTVNKAGAVAAFHADYQIVDSAGVLTVHGSKDLVAAASDLGACFSDAFSYDAEFATQASYSATIDTASGSYRDTGSSSTTGEGADVLGFFSLTAPEGAFSTFTETFDSSSGVAAVGTGGKVTGGGWIEAPSGDDKATFGFEAQTNPAKGLQATCTFVDHTAKMLVKCLGATSLVVNGTHATFSGNADVGGVTTTYQIDVDDLGEPGRHDTFTIVTGNGYSASGVLLGGNIQIHAA